MSILQESSQEEYGKVNVENLSSSSTTGNLQHAPAYEHVAQQVHESVQLWIHNRGSSIGADSSTSQQVLDNNLIGDIDVLARACQARLISS